VVLVGGSGADPLAEGILLLRGERLFGRGRGHDLVRVVREDAGDQFTLVGVARDDGAGSAFGGSEGGGALVEAEAALAACFVRAVAFEAVVRKDGADVAGEVRARLGGGGGEGEAEESGERQVHGREWRNARRGPDLTASRAVS